MALLVQKYGGSSVSSPEQIKAIAQRLKRLKSEGHDVVAVVSAMGKTTDQLVALANQISAAPNRRELDMLLTTGERITMALLSMALHDLEVPAISFTGSQAGVLTDGSHSNARILDLKPQRVENELRAGRVVVLAGFQGVDPSTREVTTLGRGGSDTTAVAMAAHFKALRCEILKDVDGVYSADPRLIQNAFHRPELNYESLLEMTFWGAKVLHYRCVELASRLEIPLVIALAHGQGAQTCVQKESHMFESAQVLSVNSHEHVAIVEVRNTNTAFAVDDFHAYLTSHQMPWPQVLSVEHNKENTSLLVTAAIETLRSLHSLQSDRVRVLEPEWSSVTATCYGTTSNDLFKEMLTRLQKAQIEVQKVQMSSLSITVFVAQKDLTRAIQTLHGLVTK